jgi:hypothetical protein
MPKKIRFTNLNPKTPNSDSVDLSLKWKDSTLRRTEAQLSHMEDYEEEYARGLGIKIDEQGWTHGKRSGDLDDSLRDYILERIKENKKREL